MPGLLDLIGRSTGNADKDAAVNQGLLQMGLAMLTNKGGNFGQVLGQGGQAGLQGYNQANDQQFQAAQRAQMQKDWQEKQRQQDQQTKMRELMQQYSRTPEQAALAGGGGPTATNAAKIGTQPAYDFAGYANALAQYDPNASLELKARLAKPTRKLAHAPAGSVVYDEGTGQQVLSVPDKAGSEPEALRALKSIYGEGSPEYAQAARQYAEKITTHSPGVTVANYGSPVPVQLADGTTGLVQPSNKAGQPPVLMKLPGSDKPLAPAKDPNALKLTESQGNATTFAARMRGATQVIDKMESAGISGSDPSTFAAGNSLTNFAASPGGQQYRQAQENWVTANLRKESGAAIPKDEMEKDIAKWFPKVGDSPQVRRQKTAARKVAEEGMLMQAGPGAKEVPGMLKRSGLGDDGDGWSITPK